MSIEVASARFAPFGWDSAWLYDKRWDLTYIILSAGLVAVPLLLYYQLGVPTDAIDILVAIAVGGPHMYSTYTLTFMEPTFRRRYPTYATLALLIPVGVVSLALWNLTILLTIFMFWASIHVLHQIVYLTECYRARGKLPTSRLSQAIDYAAIFSSLYPFAIAKLVDDQFVIGKRLIQLPAFAKGEWLVTLVWVVFLVSLTLWLLKSARELWQGQLNLPKTLLMAITIGLAFTIPTFDNLDVAFQGMNVWHSCQYLALIWYVNKLRKDQGEIGSRVIRSLSGEGTGTRFYLFNVGITVAGGVAVAILRFGVGLAPEQAYYIVILSCLLVHYYVDHFLFTRIGNVVRPG